MLFEKNPSQSNLIKSIIGTTLLIALILIFLPAEKTLGEVIKLVYLHAALVQSGLLLFMAAGVLGLADLIKAKNRLYAWASAAQKMAIIMWALYMLSSMIVTYLSWGVAIAWEEPRVQMSIRIMVIAIVFFLVSIWLKNRKISDIINMITAILVMLLSLTTVNIRHPNNPVGTSDSFLYAISYYFVLILTLFLTFQLLRLIFRKSLQ